MPSNRQFLTDLGLELAYFSGMAWLSGPRSGGAGVILRFERVRPLREARFQPLRSREITPRFLDSAITALKRWKFDIVSMDEVTFNNKADRDKHWDAFGKDEQWKALTSNTEYSNNVSHADMIFLHPTEYSDF